MSGKMPISIQYMCSFSRTDLLCTGIRYWDLCSLCGMNKIHENVGGDETP